MRSAAAPCRVYCSGRTIGWRETKLNSETFESNSSRCEVSRTVRHPVSLERLKNVRSAGGFKLSEGDCLYSTSLERVPTDHPSKIHRNDYKFIREERTTEYRVLKVLLTFLPLGTRPRARAFGV